MDIEQFYDADPRRRASDEIQFGREWTEGPMYFEVAWIADTGELYAMAEPYDRRGVSPELVTVEILAVLEGRTVIDTVMAGWQDAMSGENSLAWVRARVEGR
jgi:hypothetical protein